MSELFLCHVVKVTKGTVSMVSFCFPVSARYLQIHYLSERSLCISGITECIKALLKGYHCPWPFLDCFPDNSICLIEMKKEFVSSDKGIVYEDTPQSWLNSFLAVHRKQSHKRILNESVALPSWLNQRYKFLNKKPTPFPSLWHISNFRTTCLSMSSDISN